MTSVFTALFSRAASSPWRDHTPVREELFGIERLEQHASTLAAAQTVSAHPPRVLSLHRRLNDNAKVLLAVYRASAAELANGRGVVPAAEWLLDNYHLVEEQIREIRDDLPPGYYRQLPKLAAGPFAGYPRVLGLAWAFIAHTDSHFDPEILQRYLTAYQQVQPLTIGELWAVAITLRIVLIENLRRLADQISLGLSAREEADALANRLLEKGAAHVLTDKELNIRSRTALNESFAAQLAKRLRDHDPLTTPTLGWLEERLGAQGSNIDEVVQHAQQRQGASNLSVRNIINSMRLISSIDWALLFESVSLVDARLATGSDFAAMDFATRNLYRSAIEQLARGSACTELEVAEQALQAAHQAHASHENDDDPRLSDPGYHLIAEGRLALEQHIDFRPPLRLRISRGHIRLGMPGYVAAIVSLACLLLGLALYVLAGQGVSAGWLLALGLLGFLPASEVATALVNRAVSANFGAMGLPGLELIDGVPSRLRTLIAVPTLLGSEADLLEQIERLEVHHLSGDGGDLTFALLTDGLDAAQEQLPGDAALLQLASHAIGQLNLRYGPGVAGSRFLLLHRRRQFNPSENVWMGWERKRGKLHELNRLLRGADDTSFIPVPGLSQRVPAAVRYVITLDADTRLPRDAALRLIGKMAHPLNQPRFSQRLQRVVGGYAILQPRVTPSLPLQREGSLYQKVFSSPGGMDPYAAAVSDVYQDLFGEGSFTGKGIYDIDAFEASLAGRVTENSMLSHDLFEGVFARAGLASDIEVVEEFPSRYDVASKRQHRWTRGDWQLLPWILGPFRGARALPSSGRWKMLDNLRRSVLAPATLAALAVSWLLPLPAALTASLLLVASLLIPALLPLCFGLLPARAGIRWRSHLAKLRDDLLLALLQSALTLTFLADQSWRMLDAISRTLSRLLISRRHLLEWTTAAQTAISPRLKLLGFYRGMLGGTLLGLLLCGLALAWSPASWLVLLPFALLWLSAPAIALQVSRSPRVAKRLLVDPAKTTELRLIARRTWRFFETFVNAAENQLPPDNFQEDPKSVIAHRTSPTNMGLYLLCVVAARDFGWAGTQRCLARLQATLAVMAQLQRHRGHFFNWYDTQDLRPLAPIYVSSVDSGNLAGHLLVVANACEEWLQAPVSSDARQGLHDTLQLASAALATLPLSRSERGQQLHELLLQIDVALSGVQPLSGLFPVLLRLSDKAAQLAGGNGPLDSDDHVADLLFWLQALSQALADLQHDAQLSDAERTDLQQRLRAVAEQARSMALAMDFAFLLEPERKLLSIGFCLSDNSLDSSCYDLLASEARLASLFAIAKGDVSTRHWFRLGRTATPLGNGSALISWSGSMFEYLMPSLVMRAPAGSLLEQTNRLVVARQAEYGNTLGIPWGISESAYNARDLELTYQYSNFGVPGLGLKRGLSANRVIAPYATGLATMVDPQAALANYQRLAKMGALGRYGYYEALDFTPKRLPDEQPFAIVRNFMAHHQGMSIVAIANTLHDGQMRARFHREPMIQACELLLQERMPRNVAVAHPRAEEVDACATEGDCGQPSERRLNHFSDNPPTTHLLSNGRYSVMLTASGAGYSRWRDIAITRWQEDSTRDHHGSFIFLWDTQNDSHWSLGAQPSSDMPYNEVVFAEDYASYSRQDGNLSTALEILVSGEDDGEVRRVSLTNSGRVAREIELTSYAELVLASAASDNAHPAFSKLFVVTEYLPAFAALIATRRPRSASEQPIWAAHFAVVEGQMKRLAVDLVIINEHASSYLQDLQVAIETAVRSSQSRPRFATELAQGSVFVLRADLLTGEFRERLQAVARVLLVAHRGPVSEQLARIQPITPPLPASAGNQHAEHIAVHRAQPLPDLLEFDNGLGGFDLDGREYVVHLDAWSNTPAPWINVIANAQFGFQVSAEGSGYTWADNSRENQLTPWSNDPVSDPPGEALYVRDEDSLALYSPTAQPLRDSGHYEARHGFGYSRFSHQAGGIAMELLQYVPLHDPIKISRLTLRNLSDRPRRLSVSAYAEWVLGTTRAASAAFIVSRQDAATGAILVRNRWSIAFAGRSAFSDLGGQQSSWTADRCEFIGRNGSLAQPAALARQTALSGNLGAGLDPCTALQCELELQPGESTEVLWLLGQCTSEQKASALIKRYRQADLDAVLAEVQAHWQQLLGAVQVQTPSRAMDIMLNGWLLYQTLACRIWARSAFYQASGAYGFRDQLQDGMALTFASPEMTRRHILRAASRQFIEGDVQHWWLPHSGQGVRTRISDDRVWLAYATAQYIQSTADKAILDEPVDFLEGPQLAAAEHDAFFQPMQADAPASLFEHCARGLDQCLQLTGELGLPLMGGGDWNDGMNRVGEHGKGESVWLGWLLLRTIALFAPYAEVHDRARAARWQAHAEALRNALQAHAWDGQWYRRATFDDGTWLGSAQNTECQIDSIAQSWAVLSEGADPVRANMAMASLQRQLVREDDGIALLFTPPFDTTPLEPGYIKGYPPGLRENGGQYSHAAMWAILAYCRLGSAQQAFALFDLVNPINHSLNPEASQRYKVEPYVLAADVYAVAPHIGRGGWTWYTGAAGWMYRAGIEGILGIRREGDWLLLEPCIPADWPGFSACIRLGDSRYQIELSNPAQRSQGIRQAWLDEQVLDCAQGHIKVALDGAAHQLRVEL